MNLAHRIISSVESDSPTISVVPGEGRRKKETLQEQVIEQMIAQMKNDLTPQKLLDTRMQLRLIECHPLYVEPATSVDTSYRFGWNRGLAMKVETVIRGRWFKWLNIIHHGELNSGEALPSCTMDNAAGTNEVQRMLQRCMNHVRSEGERADVLIDWIGYSLGISWCKRPTISEKLWNNLYQEFDISLFLLHPSDHLSHFMAEEGNQSGLNGYFPTPISITTLINMILGSDNPHMTVQSVFEPCLGAGAMLLPTNSLAPVGVDLNLLLVKAASIQAFCYLPPLLYTPSPIIGLHYSREEARLNKYFEFRTNTRIYCGDSLIGELKAPLNIFQEDSEWIDIFLNPLDLQKREVFQYEEEMAKPWSSLSKEMKYKIVVAQARELGFDCVASNPPFGKLNRYTLERIEEIEASNKLFVEQRKKRLALQNIAPHPMVEEIHEDVEIKMNEIGQYQLF